MPNPDDGTDRPIARRVAWVSAARLALLAAWFGTTAVAAEHIGPTGFSIYYLSQVAVRIASEFIGEPLDGGVMRDVPVASTDDQLAVFWAAMWLRVIAGVAVMAIAVATPRAVAVLIFNDPALSRIAVFAAAGVLGDLLLRGVLGFLQATERFRRFMIVDVVWQLARVSAVGALIYEGRLTASTFVAVYVIAPYVASAVGFVLIGAAAQFPRRAAVGRLLHYVKWIAIGLGVGALLERTDVWLLSRFRGATDVGVYGMAMFLASIPDYLSGIVQTTLTPRVPPAIATGGLGQLSRRFWAVAIPAGLILSAAAVGLSGWVVPVMLPKYAAAVPAFRLLVVMSVLNLTVTPLATAAVNLAAPRAATVISVLGFVTVASVGLMTIPAHGAMGAAAAMVFAKVVVAVATLAAASRLGRRPSGVRPETSSPMRDL